MTNEQINILAEEYARRYPEKGQPDIELSAILFLQWLSERCVIIVKSNPGKNRMCLRDKTKVCNVCHECDIDISQPRY